MRASRVRCPGAWRSDRPHRGDQRLGPVL